MNNLMLLVITASVLAIYLIYSKLVRTYEYWGRKGVRSVTPTFLIGNMGPVLLRKTSMIENFQQCYNECKRSKFGGFYEFLTPLFMPIDPELIRDMSVKNFDHFSDRRGFVNEKSDPLIRRAMINLKGDEWREMRNRLSPAFTSSKLRGMFPLIENCCRQLAHFMVTRPDANTEPIEVQDAFSKFSNDVIATVAFGHNCNAVQNPKERFYVLGQELLNVGFKRFLVLFGYLLIPKVMEFLNIPFMPREHKEYFRQLIFSTMQSREREGITRPDMLQLLMVAQKEGLKLEQGDEPDPGTIDQGNVDSSISAQPNNEGKSAKAISDDDIAAQAFLFFLAGFETVSILLSFLTHELAVNPDVQDQLRAELEATIAAHGGKLTYESIHNMQYLDMVVSETLRKNPPAPITDRTCTKNYVVPGTDVLIEDGSSILLPIYALHHDPEFFPDPEKFDPERFSKENRKNIRPYTYLPFGSGPHNCLGMRLALLEVKLCICHILAACELKVSAKTQVPLKLTKKSFRMQPDDGFWVTAIPRPQALLTTL